MEKIYHRIYGKLLIKKDKNMKINDLIIYSHVDNKYTIKWDYISNISEFKELQFVEQSPEWHSEGTAWNHTKLVVEEAVKYVKERNITGFYGTALIASALFHDIGKSATTFTGNDGKIHSYGHEKFSDKITRKLLWDEDVHLRELVCNCVKLHMMCHDLKKLKQYSAFKKRIEYLKSNSLNFTTLCELHFCDVSGSIYNFANKQNDLSHSMYLIRFANDFESLRELYHFIHPATSTVHVLIGLPGAGKSTYAESIKTENTVILSRDIIRTELGFCNEGEKVICTKEQEDLVTEVFEDRFINALDARQNVIIDNLNLKRSYRDDYKQLTQGYNICWNYVYIQTPSLEDNYNRRPTFSKEVIDGMINKLDYPDPSEYDNLVIIWK